MRTELAAVRSTHEDITEVAVAAIGDQRWLWKEFSGFRVTRQDVKDAKEDSLDGK